MGNSLLETKVAGAAAFAKFMTVLQAVADAQQPPTAAALARACGYPRPTVYRILAALAEQGMLMESGGAYRLGPRLLAGQPLLVPVRPARRAGARAAGAA